MRRLAMLGLAGALAFAVTPVAAHPLGNFTISHYAALEVGRTDVSVRYVIDMAEIPTFQEMQEPGLVAQDGHPSVARGPPRRRGARAGCAWKSASAA
jgi:hypothetical protein